MKIRYIANYFSIIYILCLVSFSLGCVNWGVARLPDANMLFITTAEEEAFVSKKKFVVPYQPIGILEIRKSQCSPCNGTMTGKYSSLDIAINKQLIEKARDQLGGEAVTAFEPQVSSTFDVFLKAAKQNPYFTYFLPFAYIFNWNYVQMKGVVAKKKR